MSAGRLYVRLHAGVLLFPSEEDEELQFIIPMDSKKSRGIISNEQWDRFIVFLLA
jgi:hypothetical protein